METIDIKNKYIAHVVNSGGQIAVVSNNKMIAEVPHLLKGAEKIADCIATHWNEYDKLKEENAALKEQAETWKDIAIEYYNCTGDMKWQLPKCFIYANKRLSEYDSATKQ